jgi:spermidine/putrescine transport system permease protein
MSTVAVAGRRRFDTFRVSMKAYAGLVYLFLFLPIVVLIVMSLNSAQIGVFPLKGVTGAWYAELWRDSAMWSSLRYSLIVAAATVAATVPLGLMAAFGLVRLRFRGQGLFTAMILAPLLVPGILIGISMLSLFHAVGIGTSLFTVFLGHSALALPYTSLIIAARLQGLDPALEEAAAGLGASRWNVLRRVTLPLLAPGLLGAALFAFTISFGEIVVTFFVSGFDQTLPLHIWSLLKIGITPAVNAISAIIMLAGILAVTVAIKFTRTP